jgi:hypothetical protein
MIHRKHWALNAMITPAGAQQLNQSARLQHSPPEQDADGPAGTSAALAQAHTLLLYSPPMHGPSPRGTGRWKIRHCACTK